MQVEVAHSGDQHHRHVDQSETERSSPHRAGHAGPDVGRLRPEDFLPEPRPRCDDERPGEAGLERGGQVGRFGAVLTLGSRGLLPAGLGRDQLEHALAVAVLVGLRSEAVMQRLHEPPGHLHLALAGSAARAGDVELRRVDQLVGEVHGVQGQHAVERAHRDQVLAVVEHPPPEAGARGLAQRIVEQPVGVVSIRRRHRGSTCGHRRRDRSPPRTRTPPVRPRAKPRRPRPRSRPGSEPRTRPGAPRSP